MRVAAGWEKARQSIEAQHLERAGVLAHGGTLNALLCLWQGLGTSFWRLAFFQFDWAGTACMRFDSDIPWIRWINDARHIDNLRRRLPAE